MPIEFSLLPPGQVSYPLCCNCITPSNSHLFFPDIKYLVKFANGDIGIADNARSAMIKNNINKCKTPTQLGMFAQSSGAILKKAPSSYFSNGVANVPSGDITLSTTSDSTGFKALEKSVIQSIFQSQKPYMEIILLLVAELIEIEDIIARVLALADISLIPKYNPNALGYLGGNQTVYSSLGQLNSLSGYASPPVKSSTSSNPGTGSNVSYDVISTIYSTGQYDPVIDYTYQYIDIPSVSIDESQLATSATPSSSDDPYNGIRPTTMIFGIWDNNGVPINPPNWLTKSGKWFGQFPFLTGSNYIWQKPNNANYVGTAPPDNTGGWTVQRYTTGTFTGEPIIYFSNNETQALINYYTGYLTDSLNMNSSLSNQEKTSTLNTVLGIVEGNNNITNQLQNESIYGFLPSLTLSGGGTSPLVQMPLSPNDVSITGTQSIWVDPETEYDMKLIKCDSTINITYVNSNGTQQISTTIIRFITNTLSIIFSNNSKFNAVLHSGSSASTYTGVTEFALDNPSNSTNYTLDISFSNSFPSTIIGAFQISTDVLATITSVHGNNTLQYTQYTLSSSVSSSLTSGNISIQNGQNNVTGISFESGIIVRWYTSQTAYVTSPPGNWANDNFNLTVTANTKTSTLYYVINGVNIIQYSSSSSLPKPDTIPSSLTVTLPNGAVIDVTNGIVSEFYVFKGKNIKSFLPTTINTENIVTIDNNFNTSIKTISIPPNSIRVEASGNPFGAMIDASQVTNSQLEIKTPYSSGFYGSCYAGQSQDIAQIYRYMKSATDSQTFYMLEGIYSQSNLQNSSVSNSSQGVNGVVYPANEWYKKPQSLGAIKEFATMLCSIFSKLLPSINTLESLFSDPNGFPKFLEQIIINNLGDSNGTGNPNFLFFSKTFMDQFNNLANIKPSQRSSVVKNSQLSNFVNVDESGNYKFILDGAALCDIFGITFGIDINKLSPTLISSTQSGSPSSEAMNQPILAFILNLVTLPFNIIKDIIDYITNFFKNLTFSNLQNEIADFISFKWILQFFNPTSILQLAGINLNLAELTSWIKNYSSSPKNSTFDLNKILSAPFIPALFTATKSQFKSLEETPIEMIMAILSIFQAIINAFIDFIWSVLGLGAILAPPCLNLIS